MIKYLKHNYTKRPLMKGQDFLKMIYQAEFGIAHLQRASDVLSLIEECSLIKDFAQPLFEEISDKMCRINLGACQKMEIPMQTVSAVVSKTTKTDGNLLSLEKRCDDFLQLVQSKFVHIPFFATKNLVTDFLKAPTHMHHSASYRQNYDPHYRIALTKHAQILPLLSAIDKYCERNLVCFVAIDGDACSGKTTVATQLQEYYPDSYVIHCDDFFLPPERKTEQRMSEVGGNVDYERLEETLSQAKLNLPFEYQKYNCSSNAYQRVAVQPKRVVIVEGTYSLRQNLKDFFDVKCRLTINKDTQQKRLLQRNPQLMTQFNTVWLPQEAKYFSQNDFEDAITLSMEKL